MIRWIAASLAALLAASPVAAQNLSLTYLGQQVVPFGQTYSGTTIGGLSGIDYDAASDRYIAISDDPANARFYTLDLALAPTPNTGFSGVTFTGVTALKAPNGAGYASGTIDPEAIRFSSSSTIIYASEGFATTGVAPFVREANLDGGYLRDFTIPGYYNPAAASGIRNNLAFESLTLANGGATVVTALEGALLQDGPAATATNGSPSRILLLSDLTSLPTAEYVYQNDPVAFAPAPGSFVVNGLVELLSVGGTQYLALERSFTVGGPGTGYAIKLYGIDTAAATNVLGTPALAGTSYTPVSKTLLFDFATLGVPLDNIEGITFGETLSNGQRSLIVVADDNFGAAQQQQVFAFAVGATAAVPEPASWALMIIGFGVVGGAMRRRSRQTKAV
jgi:hypothetical protein